MIKQHTKTTQTISQSLHISIFMISVIWRITSALMEWLIINGEKYFLSVEGKKKVDKRSCHEKKQFM